MGTGGVGLVLFMIAMIKFKTGIYSSEFVPYLLMLGIGVALLFVGSKLVKSGREGD